MQCFAKGYMLKFISGDEASNWSRWWIVMALPHVDVGTNSGAGGM